MASLLFPLISIAPGPPDELLDTFPTACDVSLFLLLRVILRATQIESTLLQKQLFECPLYSLITIRLWNFEFSCTCHVSKRNAWSVVGGQNVSATIKAIQV